MTLGVVMLVHSNFDRAEQMVRHWVAGGCPVTVHVDKKADAGDCARLIAALGDQENVSFSERFRCEWGTWGLVAATQAATAQLLAQHPDLRHVYLASGACLPLRPIAELRAYLDTHPDTDFIESATTADVPWTVGGLDRERFTLRFPFSWKKHRKLFDRYVKVQQLLGFKRRIPNGIKPHMGSQWWCLTKTTLTGILNDPRRAEFDHYFRKVWIPDESYYQTLARLHARKIESRSLTLSKFDYQGKPHIFYDDHQELLLRSDAFVARKIWPQADGLFNAFPRKADSISAKAEPNTSTIDRVFTKAVERRKRGRPGLYMQSRFPVMERENGFTAARYTMLQGFDDIFPDFGDWLGKRTGATVHGHLYAKDRAHFAGEETIFRGGLSDSARLRDYNGAMFLTNLIWNGRDSHQCFQFGPADTQQIRWMLAKDTRASVWVVSGAWSIPLFLSRRPVAKARAQAARMQQIEHKLIKVLRSPYARARIRILTLADFVEAPMDTLQAIIDEMAGHRAPTLTEVPKMADLTGFAAFLQELKNQGMHPFLTGDFATDTGRRPERPKPPKPYIIGQK
ncbi:beta-1,6-N-acetylglucosaminyltransferase [Loktanella agnita]|uniref:DUF5927 domain-containing protein n=1 Tax=Loktanella agnita TaxID=287097 RepID=UPI0039882664